MLIGKPTLLARACHVPETSAAQVPVRVEASAAVVPEFALRMLQRLANTALAV